MGNQCTEWYSVFTAKQMRTPLPSCQTSTLPDENRASVPLSWPPPNNLPLHRGLGFGCVSTCTGQHRIDYCWSHKTESQGKEEGWWLGTGGGGGEKLAFNEWAKSSWTTKHGSPRTYVCALMQGHYYSHTHGSLCKAEEFVHSQCVSRVTQQNTNIK